MCAGTVTKNKRLQRLCGIFSRVIAGLDAPVMLSGKTLETEEAADPCGLLPVFMLEACSVWEAISGKPVAAPIHTDEDGLLGICVDGAPKLPMAVALLCLTEAASSVLRDTRALLADPSAEPAPGQPKHFVSADALLSRWADRIEEFRNEPVPAPQVED
jgi:hypothetical protein